MLAEKNPKHLIENELRWFLKKIKLDQAKGTTSPAFWVPPVAKNIWADCPKGTFFRKATGLFCFAWRDFASHPKGFFSFDFWPLQAKQESSVAFWKTAALGEPRAGWLRISTDIWAASNLDRKLVAFFYCWAPSAWHSKGIRMCWI